MKPFQVSSGIFPSEVYVSFGPADEFAEYLKEIGAGEESVIKEEFTDLLDSNAITLNLKPGHFAIWFNGFTQLGPAEFSMVAHECFHLTEMIFDWVQIPHSKEFSSEAWAYTIQHFCYQIVKNWHSNCQ